MNVKAAIESQGLVAQNSSRVTFPKRLAHPLIAFDVLAAYIDEGRSRLDGHRAGHDAFNKHMRVALHDLTIFESAWFTFVGVNRQIARAAIRRWHKAPLHADA